MLKRVLLDECVPRRLSKERVGHDVTTVPAHGWSGVKNGNLLRLAATEFDCLLTVDTNLQFQQNTSLPIAVLLVKGKYNTLPTMQKLVPDMLAALSEMQPCQYREVGA